MPTEKNASASRLKKMASRQYAYRRYYIAGPSRGS